MKVVIKELQNCTITSPEKVSPSLSASSCSFLNNFCWKISSKFASLLTAQLKQSKGQQKFSSPPGMGTQTTAPPPPPPPAAPKESFARRYKYLWPMLLAVNLGVGGDDLSSP